MVSPFSAVLADRCQELPHAFREQYLLAPGAPHRLRFTGTMRRVWHRPRWLWPVLRLLAMAHALFPDQGASVRASMVIEGEVDRRGVASQTWRRTFDFPSPRRFDAVVALDASGRVTERVGPLGLLEILWRVHFEPPLTMHIVTDGVRLAVRQARVPLPRSLGVHVEAWETAASHLARDVDITLVVRHRWLGDIFGYDGCFRISRERIRA